MDSEISTEASTVHKVTTLRFSSFAQRRLKVLGLEESVVINTKLLSRTGRDSPSTGPQHQHNNAVVTNHPKAASQTEAASRVLTGKALHKPSSK